MFFKLKRQSKLMMVSYNSRQINNQRGNLSLQMQGNRKESISNGVGVKQYAIYEQKNMHYRPQMEDTSFVHDCFLPNCPKSTLVGVFDGHGGKQISSRLAIMLPNVLKNQIKTCKGLIPKAMELTFVDIDKNLGEGYTGEAGSTGTVALITIQQSKRMLYVAHVGDSSAYLFDDAGFQLLTPEHRGNNQSQRKRVQQNGGKILNNRLCGVLAVTRAFGDYSLKKMGLTAYPQLKKTQIRLSHKYLVMGSDGLWDFVDVSKVHKILKNQTEADDITRALLKMAIQNGSNDNVTVVVVKLN